MGHKYLNDDGGNVAPYESTTNAATTLAGLLAGTTVAVDEHIWVKSDHADNTYTAQTTMSSPAAATITKPQRIICVSDWDSSPGTLATGAAFGTNGSYLLIFEGKWYFDGITFGVNAGTAGTASYTRFGTGVGPTHIIADNCIFKNEYSSTSITYALYLTTALGAAVESSTFEINNSQIWLSNTNSYFCGLYGTLRADFCNLSFHTSSSAPSLSLFYAQRGGFSVVNIFDSDLSGVAWSYILNVPTGWCDITLRNCKLPSGITPTTGTPEGAWGSVTLINCSSTDSYTAHEIHRYEGVSSVVTSVYADTTPADMSSAANDTYCIKMTTTAATSRFLPLYSQWMCVWNDAASYTPSVEVLVGADGASALNNDELFIEVDYNSGTDSPLGTRLTTLPGILETPAACAAGTTAWTGDGYTTERTHELSTAQITPDKPGYIWIRVALAKPSTTIYVNPARP